MQELKRFGVSSVEQPIPAGDVEELARVQRLGGLPVVADESLCTVADARLLRETRAADIWNLRLAKIGGFTGFLTLLQEAGYPLPPDCTGHGFSPSPQRRNVLAYRPQIHLGVLVGETSLITAAARACLGLCPYRHVEYGYPRVLLKMDPFQGDPGGYSLIRTLLELQRTADSLLKGGSFLRRQADQKYALSANLARDLAVWVPDGQKLLLAFQRLPSSAFAVLDTIRARQETGRGVDVMELVDLVRTVLRLSLYAAGPAEAVRDCLVGVGELIKAQYRRIFAEEEQLARIGSRIDRQIAEFLDCWDRLKWFAHQLYPPLLKMLRLFRREEQMVSILPRVLRFAGLQPNELLTLQSPLRFPQPAAPPPMVEKPEELPPIDIAEEFRGIFTILNQAFPGCRIERIAEGD
ncbi:MAG: enolase C-terminal domain-like protein, partial [candidate division WOR-3 bacterium]